MYSPKVIAASVASVESKMGITLKEHTIAEVEEWNYRLNKLINPESTPTSFKGLTRPLSEEENLFISNELLMSRINYPYWATRYAWIRRDKGGEIRMQFWESQEMILKVMGALEESLKPILLLNLKARQVGSSTLAESVMTHRVITTPGITSLVAADEPGQSEFMFNMMERLYDKLPYWMRPHRKFNVKGTQMFFDELDSNILVDSGNRRVGGMGQGKAVHLGHLSELATWENPDMVTEDLFPAVMSALSPQTFFIMEFTAKGKVNATRDWWINAKRKKFYGFTPVFIPWYAIKEKYATDPPSAWIPTTRSLTMAKSIEATKNTRITKKQLYWWEKTYESYREDNRLNAFYAEYASDDEEAFQLTGKSIFPLETVQDLRRKAMLRPYCPYQIETKGRIQDEAH